MREKLLTMSEDELRSFVKERLTVEFQKKVDDHIRHCDISKEHLRFDMSGYGIGDNDCYFHNLEIVKLFADCGIWDHVAFLYLDAYKGTMKLYWKWWCGDEDDHDTDDQYSGESTTNIIMDIITMMYILPTKKGWKSRRFF